MRHSAASGWSQGNDLSLEESFYGGKKSASPKDGEEINPKAIRAEAVNQKEIREEIRRTPIGCAEIFPKEIGCAQDDTKENVRQEEREATPRTEARCNAEEERGEAPGRTKDHGTKDSRLRREHGRDAQESRISSSAAAPATAPRRISSAAAPSATAPR